MSLQSSALPTELNPLDELRAHCFARSVAATRPSIIRCWLNYNSSSTPGPLHSRSSLNIKLDSGPPSTRVVNQWLWKVAGRLQEAQLCPSAWCVDQAPQCQGGRNAVKLKRPKGSNGVVIRGEAERHQSADMDKRVRQESCGAP